MPLAEPPLHSGGPQKLYQLAGVGVHQLRALPPVVLLCTWTPIFHSLKNAQVVIPDNDRSLSTITTCKCALCIGLLSEVAVWYLENGPRRAEVRSPGIRPATEDDIRHNAPGLLETVHRLLRIKVRRKLLNQDKTSHSASYALQQHEPKSAASEFSFLLAVLRLL